MPPQESSVRISAGETARRFAIPGTLVLGLAALAVLQPTVSAYYQSLLVQAFLFAILAVSVDLLWGYAGILSFGQSAFFGIGGYAIAITFVHITTAWWAWPLAVVAGIVLGGALAAALAWFAFYSRTNLPVLYIAVITLAAAVIFEQVMLSGGSLTGASSGLAGFSTTSFTDSQWYWVAGVALLLSTVAVWVVVRSDAGRVLVAIRDNEERCRYLGINVPLIKTGLFTAAGALAAMSGILYVAYAQNVAPSLAGFVLATNVVIWVALGGRGTLIGPILGAIIVNVFGASLNARYPFHWLLFLGTLFVVVVMFIPEGIFPGIWKAIGKAVGWRRSSRSRRGEVTVTGPSARPSTGRGVRADGSGDGDSPSLQPTASGPRRLSAGDVALDIDDVRKSFGSFEAVGGVSLSVRAGELVSVVGPNGAGKTSLVRCIANGRERSAGALRICGESVGADPPHRLVELGVGRKFQAANVFDSLTVAESLRLASWRGSFPSIWRRTTTLELPSAAIHVLEMTGLAQALDEKVSNLGHGQKQALELAMVLALDPTVVLLDEPTAGLTREERLAIASVLTHLVERGDLCIVLIEHDFDFVKQISTRMVVLHEGKLLLDGTVRDVAESEVVRSVYLGHSAH